MSGRRAHSAAWFFRSGVLLLSISVGSCAIAFAAQVAGNSATPQTSATAADQSDPAAISAISNVIVQSGGLAAWQNITSAKETFTVSNPGAKTSQVHLLLDDWSLDSTRYRRGVQGQQTAPPNHNGESTFTVQLGNQKTQDVPEFDQARVLVSRLPAASAEVMLRRSEYVLKLNTSEQCANGMICVDVYRKITSQMPSVPEQRWNIATATGLPASIRIELAHIGRGTKTMWMDVHYLQFATEQAVTIPTAMETTGVDNIKQTWTFVSFKKNSGFDTATFDQEVTR